MVNIGMRWISLILILLVSAIIALSVVQCETPSTPTQTRPDQSAGPLQPSEPTTASQSSPLQANGPLQNSGPLQPAAPIQHTAPIPEMNQQMEMGLLGDDMATPGYHPILPDNEFVRFVDSVLASMKDSNGAMTAPTSEQIQTLVDRVPPPFYNPTPPGVPGQLPPVIYDPGNPSQQSPR